jgi:hypothetical protein
MDSDVSENDENNNKEIDYKLKIQEVEKEYKLMNEIKSLRKELNGVTQ